MFNTISTDGRQKMYVHAGHYTKEQGDAFLKGHTIFDNETYSIRQDGSYDVVDIDYTNPPAPNGTVNFNHMSMMMKNRLNVGMVYQIKDAVAGLTPDNITENQIAELESLDVGGSSKEWLQQNGYGWIAKFMANDRPTVSYAANGAQLFPTPVLSAEALSSPTPQTNSNGNCAPVNISVTIVTAPPATPPAPETPEEKIARKQAELDAKIGRPGIAKYTDTLEYYRSPEGKAARQKAAMDAMLAACGESGGDGSGGAGE